MSNSSNGAATATTSYNLSFRTMSTYTGQGVVVDFCTSPILSSTCTAPTGFSVGAGTATFTTNSAPMNTLSWTASAGQVNTGRTFRITQATGVSFTSATDVDITITNVQNPTTLGTFYARIYTYTTVAGANGYTDTNPDAGAAHTDDGGVALSTANVVTVTAKVQETLLFCVFTSVSTTGVSCPGTISGVVIGDANGVLSSTTTNYLSNTAGVTPFYAQLGLASNATSGVIVRAKSPATLTSGANTITASGAGSGSCTADSAAAGTDQFGFNVTAGSGGTGAQTADAGYACGAGSHSFDATNLVATYGDPVLSTAGPSTEPTSEALVQFMAKASTTTKSGIYTASFTFIATGTY